MIYFFIKSRSQVSVTLKQQPIIRTVSLSFIGVIKIWNLCNQTICHHTISLTKASGDIILRPFIFGSGKNRIGRSFLNQVPV